MGPTCGVRQISCAERYECSQNYGSKTIQNTSCAVYAGGSSKSYILNNINSVFTAELLALVFCLDSVKNRPDVNTLIVCDSMSALTSIANKNTTIPLIAHILNTWYSLKSCGKNVAFLWCPSHSGISGNEIVDRATRQLDGAEIVNLSSPADLISVGKKYIYEKWQKSWTDLINNKLKSIKPTIGPWTVSDCNSRYEEVVLTRVRIGHTRLTHSYLFTRSDPPSCQCGIPLTIRHLLECRAYINPSRPAFHKIPSLDDNQDSVVNLLGFLRHINVYHLI
ncbi:hypothetical protein M8J77_011221 [Diaphorina citri]|nr:hypothetical protein M8J77_011221 [Diaphorina citri]